MLTAIHPGGSRAIPSTTGKADSRDELRRVFLVLAILSAVAGCKRDRPAGEVPGNPEEHAGHVIPAHMPKSFHDAVRRLQSLDDTIGRGAANGSPRLPIDDKTLSMATDIAGWLPEIAAESDMPEGTWDEVNRLSAALVAGYRTMKAAGGRGDTARDSGRNVVALGVVLEKADSRWFDKPGGDSGPP